MNKLVYTHFISGSFVALFFDWKSHGKSSTTWFGFRTEEDQNARKFAFFLFFPFWFPVYWTTFFQSLSIETTSKWMRIIEKNRWWSQLNPNFRRDFQFTFLFLFVFHMNKNVWSLNRFTLLNKKMGGKTESRSELWADSNLCQCQNCLEQ